MNKLISVLQWNHVFSNVEMPEITEKDADALLASMEPRFFKRGNTIRGKRVGKSRKASMEPRFFKRGNDSLGFIELQELISFNGTTFFQTWK